MRPVSFLGLALLAALALAGCGRRGPLELPPGAPPEPTAQGAAADSPAAAQAPAGQGSGIQVPRTQKTTDIFSEGAVPRPINAPPQPKTGFFLDPLL